jgi:hypothetical protein
MPDEEAILEVAALIVDGVAVSEALLAGDMRGSAPRWWRATPTLTACMPYKPPQ